ncbi:unnamed protein product [Symbiodinium sp. CCMP2592]|nr:unnamed protein product [Symbiodinium sp. CCMP2592]
MICAVVALLLCRAGMLPLYIGQRMARFWCSTAGMVGYYLTLLLWHRKKRAFLDIACIHQTDPVLKAEGLISMGAFLKNSESFLVLWDTTYISRLWCMFEMAAFLHNMGLGTHRDKFLVVCPVFVGPAFLLGQLGLNVVVLAFLVFVEIPFFPWAAVFISGLTFPCFTLLTDLMLAHCRSIDTVQNQVRRFAIEDSLCYCCSCGHVDKRTGVEMNCDRKPILHCITAWFGSVEHFETVVRGKVLTALVHQLANNVFSYQRLVYALCPVIWLYMDLMTSAPDWEVVVELSLSACSYYLMVLPSLALLVLRLAYRLRKVAFPGWCCNLLLSTGLVAVGATAFAICFSVSAILAGLSNRHFQSHIPANAAVLAVTTVVALLLWRCLPVDAISTPD